MKMPRNTTMLALSFSVFTASTAGLGLMLASKSSEIEYVKVEVETPKIEAVSCIPAAPRGNPSQPYEPSTDQWDVLEDGGTFVKNTNGAILRLTREPFEKDGLVLELHNVSFNAGDVVYYQITTNKLRGNLRGRSTVSYDEAATSLIRLEGIFRYDSFVINNMREDTQLKILIGDQEHIFGMRGSFHAITELL